MLHKFIIIENDGKESEIYLKKSKILSGYFDEDFLFCFKYGTIKNFIEYKSKYKNMPNGLLNDNEKYSSVTFFTGSDLSKIEVEIEDYFRGDYYTKLISTKLIKQDKQNYIFCVTHETIL